jgi:hypothetical protein
MMTNKGVYMNIAAILDLEKDLRAAEAHHAISIKLGLPRSMSGCRDEGWFKQIESLGFLVDGKFLSIVDIILKTEGMSEIQRVYALEAVGCDLSLLARFV